MANDVKFITKETQGKKKRIPIIGRIISHEEGKREEQFQLSEESIQNISGYTEQHRQAILAAAGQIQQHQQLYSANYKLAMEDLNYLHSLLLKGIDTHAVYQLLMSNPHGAAEFIKQMGLSNVSVADAAYSPRRTNLIGSTSFQKSTVPVANLGIIPIAPNLYMGLADNSTFYYLSRPSKDSPGVLYPVGTLKSSELSKILAELGNTNFLDNVLVSLQQFNRHVGGLVGSGVKVPENNSGNLGPGGSFNFDNPTSNPASYQIPLEVTAAQGGESQGSPSGGEMEFGIREATRVLVSGSDDLKVNGTYSDTLRERLGKGSKVARNVAAYAALAYNITPNEAATYLYGGKTSATELGRNLNSIGEQLKRGKFNGANRFVNKIQKGLVTQFAKDHRGENLPANPIEFARLMQSDQKLREQWTEFTSDTAETADAYEDFLDSRDDSDDEDDGKN